VRKGETGTAYQLVVEIARDHEGRRRAVRETFRGTKRDAEKRLAQLIVDVEAGRVGVARASTVAELAGAWWDAHSGRLSPTTRIGYRGVLDRYIIPTFGRRKIDKVKPAELDRWYAELANGTAPVSRVPLSFSTIRNVHTVLSGMFRAAVRWEWLAASPVQRAQAPTARPATFHAPEPHEVARALAAAEESDLELFTFLRFSAAVGTRRGETCALRWCDLDLDAGEVMIRQSIAPDDTNPRAVVVKDTKTHARARLALDDVTVGVLDAHRGRCVERAAECDAVLADNSFVFSPVVNGSTPWNPGHFTSRWERLRERIGLEHVRLHDWRHYHGTELAAAGVPMTIVRDRLRHSNLRTTSIYAHGRRALDRAAADAIAKALPSIDHAKDRPAAAS
jgi:integrase